MSGRDSLGMVMGRTVKVVLVFEQRQIILVLTLVTWIQQSGLLARPGGTPPPVLSFRSVGSGRCQVKAPESSVTRSFRTRCDFRSPGVQSAPDFRKFLVVRSGSTPGAPKVSGCEVDPEIRTSGDVALVATSLHGTRLPIKGL